MGLFGVLNRAHEFGKRNVIILTQLGQGAKCKVFFGRLYSTNVDAGVMQYVELCSIITT
jgi:hypothetical protein